MPANSPFRKAVKRLLAPLVPDRLYRYLQGAAMAWDIHRGRFTEPEIDLIPVAVLPGDAVVDMGANYGMYCQHLSRAVGKDGRVFAFEPVPFTCATLRIIIRMLRCSNVEIVEKGLSDRAGVVTFEVPVQDSGAISAGQAHLCTRDDDREGKARHVRSSRSRKITCELICLDDFLPELAEVSFIKADIEGAELLAFRGAEKTIDRHLPTVLCEINPWFLEGFGITLGNLTDFFFQKGYQLYHYDEKAHQLAEVIAMDQVVEDNYLFIHPRRLQRLSRVVRSSPG